MSQRHTTSATGTMSRRSRRNDVLAAVSYVQPSQRQHRRITNPSAEPGQPQSSTDPDGAVTAYGYDSGGRLETITDPNGEVTTNTWSTEGDLVAVTRP
ncbi:MAG: hypothetical protein GY745_19395, partial [Actinomycetia bacterium]|nr:hypothetical protein [Actinomycetes bacterium]